MAALAADLVMRTRVFSRNDAMTRMAYMVWVAALTLVLAARPASACSVDRIPSATEAAEGATVILRVKAERYMPAKDRRYGIGRVLFKVVETIKGDWRSPFFVSHGQVDRYFGRNEGSVPYDQVRPGGRTGGCFAYDYRLGAEYLLLLHEGDLQWAPMAPINEEIRGPDDPWLAWVRGRTR